jgi:hypothetical protein
LVLGNRWRGLVAATIRKYLSHVYTFHREWGGPHALHGCDLLPLERTRTGIDRLGTQPAHRRRAMTGKILLELLAADACSPHRPESAALRC